MFYTTSIISEEATTFWIYILDYKLSVVEFSQICHTRARPEVCCKHCLKSPSGTTRDHEKSLVLQTENIEKAIHKIIFLGHPV